jgi:hypothetical protein
MLKGFTFAPLPSARGRRKEDEKQKEMKACQRAAGQGDLICNSKEKGVGQLQQEAESA